MQRLTLIGMPGSGKSAVGRIVSDRLGWSFIDTDLCIEERFGCKLQALVDRVGSAQFGRIEEETVLELSPAGPSVIATGGSVVYSKAAMLHLTAVSTVIFLDLPVQSLKRRIEQDAPRGIVGMPEGGLEELNEERFPLYLEYAHMVVMLHEEGPDEAAAKVLSRLNVCCHNAGCR